jgi:hypothetical protein
MPSQIDTAAPTGTISTKRFTLPALDLKLGSLTDGTDIPPPLPSPIQEEAAPTLPDTAKGAQPQKSKDAANGKSNTVSPNSRTSSIITAGTKRRAEDGPASPTLSNRPGSIRRLFSRNLLNTAYGNVNESAQDGRPQSRGGASMADSKKARRSSGWFGRLRNTEPTPTPLSPPATDEKKPTGPPPPMIPELNELNTKLGIQADNTFGGDFFKNIK